MSFKLTPAEARAALATALRSGDYTQDHCALRNYEDKFCCLGVACDLFKKIEGRGSWARSDIGIECYTFNVGENGSNGGLPRAVQEWLGFASSGGSLKTKGSLVVCNDSDEEDFPTIAGRIENDEVALRKELV